MGTVYIQGKRGDIIVAMGLVGVGPGGRAWRGLLANTPPAILGSTPREDDDDARRVRAPAN